VQAILATEAYKLKLLIIVRKHTIGQDLKINPICLGRHECDH